MGLFHFALAWGLFLPGVDDGTAFLEVVGIRVRMVLLKPGMDADEVEKVLYLNRYLCLLTLTLHSSARWYEIDPKHTLFLHYHFDFDKWKDLLDEAELKQGRKLLARVPPGKKHTLKIKGLNPKLIQKAIRLIQKKK
jgi:hypothetical protein